MNGNKETNIVTKDDKKYQLFILLGLALFVRLIAAGIYKGYETDINCFFAWSEMIYKEGFANFYLSEAFTDYPPGYMYFLYVIGLLRNVFSIGNYPTLAIVLLKLPAIIFDVAAGYFIYKLVKKHSKLNAIVCATLYLFNPAIILNSAIWGQVDAVFTFFVVLMCYFITEKKLPLAYFAFAIGILIKPQTLIFTPILIFGIIDQVFLNGFKIKRFLGQLFCGLLAIASMMLLVLPFGLENVILQYTDTLNSYPYASVNAYNIWTMFGLNWATQEGTLLYLTYNQWGSLFIALFLGVATYINFKAKKDPSKYFFMGAFIVISMFVLSVRMHERYMFPALILLLSAYILKPKKAILVLYILFSISHFLNVAHVLFIYDYLSFDPKAIMPIRISIFTSVIFILLLYTIKRCYFKNKIKDTKIDEKNPIVPSEIRVKLSIIDILLLLIITVIYSAIALYDLGDKVSPSTQWDTQVKDTTFVLDLGENKSVEKAAYFIGNYEKREFVIESSNAINNNWNHVANITMEGVFSWEETKINTTERYLKFTSKSDKAVVFEMVLIGADEKIITPVVTQELENLFDEQGLYPGRSTFRDSTYFDEIYHARTAYEYIHGIYSYENTHPPLGKIFISIGMLLFGVNPFGWRIMGTLFGIAMIPLIYIFAKKFFKETWLATIVTLLFSFDFMHFTQTRIATIDVFVTFFIILMYYFIYQYTQLSFYDSNLKRTFIPLGLCGISMGLGIASKWTGVYAGVGLAVIFFLTLIKRYKEYVYAKSQPDGITGAIEHQHIIRNFKKNTIKTILFCLVFFIIIPVVIYTLSYLPFVDAHNRELIPRMVKNIDTMFNYHLGVDSTHPYSSWWYQWPIMYRPIWYYSGHVTATVSEGISAFGNPLVWWTGIPAFFYMIYLSIKKKDKRAAFLVIAYLAQYLPWIFVSRITFIYHYFPSVAFITLMVGYAMYKIVDQHPHLKKYAFIYTGIAIILFLLFYPVLSGQPVNKEYVDIWLRWFNSWVLVS